MMISEPDWAPWHLNKENRILQFTQGDDFYEVDLDDCRTSPRVLDWIIQVTEKPWATDTVIAGLIRALNDVLQPQSTLCSMGRDTHLTAGQIVELVTTFQRKSQPPSRR